MKQCYIKNRNTHKPNLLSFGLEHPCGHLPLLSFFNRIQLRSKDAQKLCYQSASATAQLLRANKWRDFTCRRPSAALQPTSYALVAFLQKLCELRESRGLLLLSLGAI